MPLCSRCLTRPATNGDRCVNCVVVRHLWDGDYRHATCTACGCRRHKRRRYVNRQERGGLKGAGLWRTTYDGVEGPAPACVPF